MSREILFRAYQKDFNKMCSVVNIGYSGGKIESVTIDTRGRVTGYDYTTYCSNEEEFPLDSLDVMQYTGLKDKNGTKIFEGDICVHNNEYHYPRPLTVEWIEDYMCFSFVDVNDYHKNYFFQKQNMDNIKVIGNIYDNRNLLK